MGLNFQDVIRDVHDPSNHLLKTSAAVASSGNVTLASSPNFIGIVTIANPGSTVAGNVTLDAGSKTQIVGNVTISDSKTYIGLTTATIGNSPVLGNGVGNIGFATVNVANAQTNTGNVTLNTSPNFIGLVTAYISNAVGNSTLNPSPNFIGLVTAWVSGIAGNITVSDSKAFIGLVTVKASVLDTYASLATLTMSIASLPTSTTGFGRQSTLVDNSSTNYTSANVYLKVYTGGLAHTPNSLMYVYLLRRDNNSVGDDGVGASDATINIVNAPLLGTILVNASLVSTAYQASFDTSPLGPLGPQWGIALVNQTGAALGGTESNHLKNWIGVNRRLT